MKIIDEWERVRRVFQAALEQPAGERAAFVAEACGGDETLLREVESLLAAHAAAGGFLEAPAYRVDGRDLSVAVPALEAGDRLGGFIVLGALGSGGMGEVYRARDTRLGREVALKLLPRALAADPQRLARFERESRILASLTHPHIAAIHGVEQIDGQRVLVLELVEGPTLAERLGQGPMEVAEALDIARHLAGALEAAHERGVVHRDLKPANIKLPLSSGIKLLDFGLAKEGLGHAAASAHQPDRTTDGLILGTCAYMSPEQARGKVVDKRTDVWAFGCLVFEMLSGTRAFPGETVSDTLAAVLEREPDWSSLPEATPAGVRRMLRRCLEKDPHRRLHDIADARLDIEEALEPSEDARASARRNAARMVTSLALLVAVGVAGALLGWWLRSLATDAVPQTHASRSTWALPDGLEFDSPPVVSPDGDRIAFAAKGTAVPARLYVRALDGLDAHPIAGTEGAKQPFWSPDGRTVAYFAHGRLMKVAIDGGAPVEICAAPDARGGSWSPRGVIVFSPLFIHAGLSQVRADGGEVQPATLVDAVQGENSHRWPIFLPDGVHFLYFVRAQTAERRGVYVGRIDRPASMPGAPLFRSESEALYAPLGAREGGVLLSVAGGRVEARPFDPVRRVLTGDPRTLDLPAGGNTLYHAMMLSVSQDVLTHVPAPIPYGQRLASSGRQGDGLVIGEERETQGWPRLSPDGRRLARSRIDPIPGDPALWVEDLERGTRARVTSYGEVGRLPVWSPDGDRLAYVRGTLEDPVLTIAAADGTGAIRTVPCPARRCDPTDWSPDGRWLLVTVFGDRDQDVWLLSVSGDEPPRRVLGQPFVERDARFSPDGGFVAYVSEETGRPEVSVQTLEGTPRREVISVGGGNQPVWSRDRSELFFVDPQGLLRSAPASRGIDGRPVFGASVLLDIPPIGSGHWGTQYDVSPDGTRFYFLDRHIERAPTEAGIVIGWQRMLGRKAAP